VTPYERFLLKADLLVAEYDREIHSGARPFYIQDPELGWVMAASQTDRSGLITTDGDGFRITGFEAAEDKRPVISLWGDSIVQGADVPDADSWAWQLQERIAATHRVLNGGVSAYGTDQALLRFEKSIHRNPSKVAILGYATTDLPRHVNVQRTFIHQQGEYLYLKPRFVLREQRLTVVTPPFISMRDLPRQLRDPEVIEFLRNFDAFFPETWRTLAHLWLNRFGLTPVINIDRRALADALQLTKHIYDRFFKRCQEHGVIGVALLLPMGQGKNISGSDFDSLITHFRSRGHLYLDPRTSFPPPGQNTDAFYTKKNHYTQHAGAILVDALIEKLTSVGALAPS